MPLRSGYTTLRCFRQTLKLSGQSSFISDINFCVSCPLQANPSHLRWHWLSYWHSCTTASCHRATSPSTWQSNWAPRSSLTQASPRQTPSRGCALRKVPITCNSEVHHMLKYYYSLKRCCYFWLCMVNCLFSFFFQNMPSHYVHFMKLNICGSFCEQFPCLLALTLILIVEL